MLLLLLDCQVVLNDLGVAFFSEGVSMTGRLVSTALEGKGLTHTPYNRHSGTFSAE